MHPTVLADMVKLVLEYLNNEPPTSNRFAAQAGMSISTTRPTRKYGIRMIFIVQRNSTCPRPSCS